MTTLLAVTTCLDRQNGHVGCGGVAGSAVGTLVLIDGASTSLRKQGFDEESPRGGDSGKQSGERTVLRVKSMGFGRPPSFDVATIVNPREALELRRRAALSSNPAAG